jgi:hypothetical protein
MEVDQNPAEPGSERWRPYVFGGLAGLPIAVMMVLVWRHWDHLASVWLIFYLLLAGLDVFWKTYTRKLVSSALMVGTIVPFLVR